MPRGEVYECVCGTPTVEITGTIVTHCGKCGGHGVLHAAGTPGGLCAVCAPVGLHLSVVEPPRPSAKETFARRRRLTPKEQETWV